MSRSSEGNLGRRISSATVALSLICVSLAWYCGGSPAAPDPTPPPPAPPPPAVPPSAATVEVAPNSVVFTSLGDTETLAATVRSQDGAVLPSASVTWASSDPTVASVEAGRVTARSNGEASVTATSGAVSGSAAVRVEQVAARLNVVPRDVRFPAIGDTARLSATVYDGNDHEVAGATVGWTSTYPDVATVSDGGLVTAVSEGTAEIVAASGAAMDPVAVNVDSTDRGILAAFYHAAGGPSWRHSDNWLTDAPLSEWYGVEARADDRVTSLELRENGAVGSLAPEIGRLSYIETLDLYENKLTGRLPPELGNATRLREIDLGHNQFRGPIPPELGSLANLWYLDLSGNSLSGTVPLIFRQLTRLQVFTFDENAGLCLPHGLVEWYEGIESRRGQVCPDREVLRELHGATGGEGWTNAEGWLGDGALGDWYGVDVDSAGLVSGVDLQGNGLSGSLPVRLGDLAGLTTLRIGDNALSGPLPTSLARTPLQELRYANTDLCVPPAASFPRFQNWLAALPQHEGTGLQCPALTDRDILAALYHATGGANWENSDNWVTDAPLSEWHGVETNAEGRVTRLDLRRNGLEGLIPPALGGLAELEVLILFANELTGAIPPALGSLAEVELVVLAGNALSGSIPPELGGLASVEELWLNGNELTSVPPELGELDNLLVLSLNFNRLTSIPPELGGLGELRSLGLWSNQLTSVPVELGELRSLRELDLDGNRLTDLPLGTGGYPNLVALFLSSNLFTSFPLGLGGLGNLEALFFAENRLTRISPELGGLARLEFLVLSSNEITSLPRELGELGNLQALLVTENRLTDISAGLGGMRSLLRLDLSSNEFTSFPRELGELGNLRQLELDGNRLTDIPPGLGRLISGERITPSAGEWPSTPRTWSEARGARGRSDEPWRMDSDEKLDNWSTLRTRVGPDRNRSINGRSRVGSFASLEILDLSSNEFSGSLPAGLLEFTGLTSLGLADNAGLAGALPLDLLALDNLEDLHTVGTELCAPADPAFIDWLDGVTRQRVAVCHADDAATAYLTQVVQSREFPVPLVAGKPALLRVFVTAARETGAGMPPVRATFYRDGAVTYELDIPAKPDPIPTEVDESSLAKSANAEIPGWVIQPGLEVVIEPDPGGTLDPALGVATRIPARGRMAVDVRAMPVFELTLVPFLWEEDPDHSIVEITAAMAADPEGHELFERTHVLLPVSELDVTAHPTVTAPTNNGIAIMELTEMIRIVEGGRGHYLGVMSGPTSPPGLLGIVFDIGSWSSFSVLDAETIAHELGHNRNLYHAPACGAGGPDRYYPYGRGNIGAWGWDAGTGELVPPERWDFMSYCEPTWVSDYQYANAVRYRIETESNSILVATADARASSSRTLLVWGGLDGDGAPHLRPAFFIDAPPSLPPADGPWSLIGRDPGGTELFSVSFAMAEFTDTEADHAGFTFALPVTWSGELASITLQGPGGAARLDRDTDVPVTILRDEATGRIRGILDGPPPPAPSPGLAAAAADQGFEILFSRGIPSAGGSE